ncbi:MAG TPA: hypothetical protein VMT11_17640 [Myxococcaceae bacterium]|nr:hypothetical protein [Myxococcaceae bacterium]
MIRRRLPLPGALLVLSAGLGACLDSTPGSGVQFGFDRCARVECTAVDVCHLPGTCDPNSGQCTSPEKSCPSGQACDLIDGACKYTCSDASCVPSDRCHLAGPCSPLTGRCAPETAKTCAAGTVCDATDGVCRGSCSNVVCPVSDACHLPGTCDPASGQCSPQSPKVCAPGLVCDLATGNCRDLCAGVVCTASDLCHLPGTCAPSTGSCSPETPRTCPSDQACDLADGQCKDLCATVSCPPEQSCDPATGSCRAVFTVPTPVAGRVFELTPPCGVAIDVAGQSYVACTVFAPTIIDFDGHIVTSTGGANDPDAVVARFDAAGHATWAFGFGDGPPPSGGNPQSASGASVTRNGNVVFYGRSVGTMTIGNAFGSTNESDYIAALRGSDGTGVWGKSLDTGGGVVLAIAANPNQASNRVAICGRTPGVAGIVSPRPANAGATDLFIAVYDSGTGAQVWAKQFGSNGNELCRALVVDDSGDVYAGGWFDSASLAFGTTMLTGPGTTSRQFIWLAKFDGSNGTPLTAVAFKGTAGNAVPFSLAVDAAGAPLVVGTFSTNVTIGSTLTSAGSTDIFIAKLTAGLAPTWAVRIGSPSADTPSGVAATSVGDVMVSGSFRGTTTGLAALTSASPSATDAFVLKLDGTTGGLQDAKAYGDTAIQTADSLAVNRFGGDQVSVTGTVNGSIVLPSPVGTLTAPPGIAATYLLGENLQ